MNESMVNGDFAHRMRFLVLLTDVAGHRGRVGQAVAVGREVPAQQVLHHVPAGRRGLQQAAVLHTNHGRQLGEVERAESTRYSLVVVHHWRSPRLELDGRRRRGRRQAAAVRHAVVLLVVAHHWAADKEKERESVSQRFLRCKTKVQTQSTPRAKWTQNGARLKAQTGSTPLFYSALQNQMR